LRAFPLFVALIACAACGPHGPQDAGIRRQRLLAERRTLEATFDQLEDRLVEGQARVHFWQEMKARHESVSAISCASMEEHAMEMARRLLPEERRVAARSPLHQARVATAPAMASEPAAPPLPAAR
jgi:hypothetical protein